MFTGVTEHSQNDVHNDLKFLQHFAYASKKSLKQTCLKADSSTLYTLIVFSLKIGPPNHVDA